MATTFRSKGAKIKQKQKKKHDYTCTFLFTKISTELIKTNGLIQ